MAALPANPPTRTTRILVVDDHPTYRYGIVQVLSEIEELDVCGEADNSTSAINAFRELRPDLVLLDVSLPGRDGIELTKIIRAENAATRVLILSMHDELFYGLRALRAGAMGYVKKDDPVPELLEAIRRVNRGEYYLSPKLQAHLVHQFIHTGTAPGGSAVEGLSDREMEVFSWLGKGLGTKQIAEQLGLSVKTIETHRAHIKEKLGAATSDEMVTLAKQWSQLQDQRLVAEPGGKGPLVQIA